MFKAFSSIMQSLQFKTDVPVIIDAETVPNECFSPIFRRLDKKSLLNCQLACHRFNDLISSDSFWIEYARILNISNVLPSLEWRRAATQKKFVGNEDNEIDTSSFNFNIKKIVLSGRGYSPITPLFISHFENARDNTISGTLRSDDFSIRANGSGIHMERDGGNGCEPHPDVSKCFVFSFTESSISVFIDLVNSGIDPWILDHVRPRIRITQKVNHRNDCAARLSFAAQLNYHETQWIERFGHVQTMSNTDHKRYKSVNKEWAQWTGQPWEDWTIEFDDYPSGIRHLTILNEGEDRQFWRGFYGPKVANIQVEVILPDEPIVKPLAVDSEKCNEDENPNAEDEDDDDDEVPPRVGVFRMPLFRRGRHMYGIPPAVARHEDEDEED
ncbi:F-box domain-containing protein [Caenorhabditis elegans]|uniref:F-box domain-containing protein n=1 Tax=Caenorhabditis elegans TaxID=6239 RepID=Q17962_CAEEL|nr:F-box domain-containing protein [Caenorhabditis elegans]CAA85486.1 F-box domain-containing protein [Caenorhabditis elegans]|eukprot:NP_497748.1 Uncharacterized protein CELE_C14B1.3 [Caenorhabditis elegans]